MEKILSLGRECPFLVQYLEDEKPQLCSKRQIWVKKSELPSPLPNKIKLTLEAL